MQWPSTEALEIIARTLFRVSSPPLQLVPESGGCNLVTLWVSWGVWHLMLIGPVLVIGGLIAGRFIPAVVQNPRYRRLTATMRNGALQAGTLSGFLGGIFFLVMYVSVDSGCFYLPL